VGEASQHLGLSKEVSESLVRQSGERAADVLSLVATDPALGRLLAPHAPHIAAEVVQAARVEGATTLEDVYSRRLRLSLRERDAGLPGARAAARLLADELGEDDAWAEAQVASYAEAVRRERGVLGLADPTVVEALGASA
jgi:glycerol-3-phosphate dehydrogenase